MLRHQCVKLCAAPQSVDETHRIFLLLYDEYSSYSPLNSLQVVVSALWCYDKIFFMCIYSFIRVRNMEYGGHTGYN